MPSRGGLVTIPALEVRGPYPDGRSARGRARGHRRRPRPRPGLRPRPERPEVLAAPRGPGSGPDGPSSATRAAPTASSSTAGRPRRRTTGGRRRPHRRRRPDGPRRDSARARSSWTRGMDASRRSPASQRRPPCRPSGSPPACRPTRPSAPSALSRRRLGPLGGRRSLGPPVALSVRRRAARRHRARRLPGCSSMPPRRRRRGAGPSSAGVGIGLVCLLRAWSRIVALARRPSAVAGPALGSTGTVRELPSSGCLCCPLTVTALVTLVVHRAWRHG